MKDEIFTKNVMNRDNANRTFTLHKDSFVYLYGAGYVGQKVCDQLLAQKYQVLGIFDERAEEIKRYSGIEVLKLRDFKAEMLNRNEIVIVCLQNGLLHEQIAEKLEQLGFVNIIFLPMSKKYSLIDKSKYRQAYRCVMSNRFEEVRNIPVYNYNDNACVVIEQNEKEISFWCPIKYLRVASKEMMDKRISKELCTSKKYLYPYVNKELKEHIPYIELMNWLNGEKNSKIDIYLDAMGRVGEIERERLLVDRKKLFDVYEEAYQYDMAFFTDSPAKGIWNEKGFFNIDDGMHRIQYLLKKGRKEVPVLVEISDYNRFIAVLKGENLI